MSQDSALDPVSPRALQPVVAHFTDVIVDRAPPVQHRARRPTSAAQAETLPAPADDIVADDIPSDNTPGERQAELPATVATHPFATTDESWFSGTLAPPERATQPEAVPKHAVSDRQLLIAAVVTISITVSSGVALGMYYASMS